MLIHVTIILVQNLEESGREYICKYSLVFVKIVLLRNYVKLNYVNTYIVLK